MLEFLVLGSGSGGNAFVVRNAACGTTVMVDAGLSARQLVTRLERVGVDPDSLSAIVLTHEHGDHTRGLDVFLRKRDVPVFANRHTAQVVGEKMKSPVRWQIVQTGAGFQIGGVLKAECFSIPHDAVDPMAYVFESCGGARLAVMTDLGFASSLVISKLQTAHAAVLEANYDDFLLQEDTKRPWSTKQRIASKHGHLSNVQVKELLADAVEDGLEALVLCHLSRDCNTPHHAEKAMADVLDPWRESGVLKHCCCAGQDEPTPWMQVGRIPEPEVIGRAEPELQDEDAVAKKPADVPPPVEPFTAEQMGLWES
ncbi:MBL fold metallo-hydrolase [Sulfuriroseicoccus oceanibius]|uniref:MBL fold metallo-hydrolase n=1 Tax=Sulfuriroseicoccus oceanibius TaxID=2707525 RepID=A0A6B3LAD6_9BACT|nr:MBL fold metallo-hydrolase [Sulfuriroseicoccus oceanibius]QQL43810.1 MBL fold metallo-hydrolase [Sulfuriroseicoccus oceanibius]